MKKIAAGDMGAIGRAVRAFVERCHVPGYAQHVLHAILQALRQPPAVYGTGWSHRKSLVHLLDHLVRASSLSKVCCLSHGHLGFLALLMCLWHSYPVLPPLIFRIGLQLVRSIPFSTPPQSPCPPSVSSASPSPSLPTSFSPLPCLHPLSFSPLPVVSITPFHSPHIHLTTGAIADTQEDHRLPNSGSGGAARRSYPPAVLGALGDIVPLMAASEGTTDLLDRRLVQWEALGTCDAGHLRAARAQLRRQRLWQRAGGDQDVFRELEQVEEGTVAVSGPNLRVDGPSGVVRMSLVAGTCEWMCSERIELVPTPSSILAVLCVAGTCEWVRSERCKVATAQSAFGWPGRVVSGRTARRGRMLSMLSTWWYLPLESLVPWCPCMTLQCFGRRLATSQLLPPQLSPSLAVAADVMLCKDNAVTMVNLGLELKDQKEAQEAIGAAEWDLSSSSFLWHLGRGRKAWMGEHGTAGERGLGCEHGDTTQSSRRPSPLVSPFLKLVFPSCRGRLWGYMEAGGRLLRGRCRPGQAGFALRVPGPTSQVRRRGFGAGVAVGIRRRVSGWGGGGVGAT